MTEEGLYGSENVLDITDEVQCYEKGKTFECECGQGIGVEHEVRAVQCASCGKLLVDHKHDEREAPEKAGEEATLSDWM